MLTNILGLLTLPYVFGGELWPNRIRSFGAAITQTFHWLFHYSMTFALPSLLSRTNNWGAFVFFASWCAAAILYVYLLVPEIAGLSVEEIERVFSGPWRLFGRRSAFRDAGSVIEGREVHHEYVIPMGFPWARWLILNSDENPKGSFPAVKSSQQSLKGDSHSSR